MDPNFRNPRVSNLTVGVEHSFTNTWTVSVNYAYVHSADLRTGGFSTTQWFRNFVPEGRDSFGRTLLAGIVCPPTCAPTQTPNPNGTLTQSFTTPAGVSTLLDPIAFQCE